MSTCSAKVFGLIKLNSVVGTLAYFCEGYASPGHPQHGYPNVLHTPATEGLRPDPAGASRTGSRAPCQ